MIVKRLITHGCSYTYGEELNDPSKDSWPAIVARELNLELHNLAKRSYANDAIVQDIVSNGSLLDQTPSLVIVAWTWEHRLTFVDQKGWFTCFPHTVEVGERRQLSDLLMATLSDTWLVNRWLTQVILLQHFLKQKNVPYLFLNSKDFSPISSSLSQQVDISRYIGWPTFSFNELADSFPKKPRLHPGEEAHAALAEIILSHLTEIYNLKQI